MVVFFKNTVEYKFINVHDVKMKGFLNSFNVLHTKFPYPRVCPIEVVFPSASEKEFSHVFTVFFFYKYMYVSVLVYEAMS
jgi:hypothetical protein